jgi:hypothetical protein
LDIPCEPYYISAPTNPITQGDIFWDCPLAVPVPEAAEPEPAPSRPRKKRVVRLKPAAQDGPAAGSPNDSLTVDAGVVRIVVVSQACDLEKCKNDKYEIRNIVVAPVYTPDELFEGAESQNDKVMTIRKGNTRGLFWLPRALPCIDNDVFPASIVDLRQLYTVSRDLLDELKAKRLRKLSLGLLYRDSLSFSLATSYGRVGTPLDLGRMDSYDIRRIVTVSPTP